MKVITQGTYSNTVRRDNAEECVSEAFLLTTDFEGFASLRYRADTFEITDARWAVHRAPDPERRGEGTAELLIGESAYIDDRRFSIRILPDYTYCVDYQVPPGGWEGVPAHKQSLQAEPREDVSPEWKQIRELFLEALRGAYQAEEYLVTERGMSSLIEYEQHWCALKPGYCRPYDPDNMPALELWPIHTGNIQHYHTNNLYNKIINYILLDEEDAMRALGVYHDSAHEMNMEFRIDRDGTILEYDTAAIRVPFAPCRELDHLNPPELKGKNIYHLTKREIGKILGGSAGCFHTVDILADITAALAGLVPVQQPDARK